MAVSGGGETDVYAFLEEYNELVRTWTQQAWVPTTTQSAGAAKKAVLSALYQVPGDLAPELPRLADDLRIWQEAVDTVARSGPETTDRSALQRLAKVATATSGQLQQRIRRLRSLSRALAGAIIVAAAGWSVSVQRGDASAVAAAAILLLTLCAVLAFCVTAAYGRHRALVITTVAGAAALFTPGVAGMLLRNGAIDAWGGVLVAGSVTLIAGGGLWFTTLPRGLRPAGRLRHLQRLTAELWPHPEQPREAPPIESEPAGDAVDRRTLEDLLDQLEEEIADNERAHRRASRTWQWTHVLLASLAALSAGAAGVVTQTQPNPELGVTILAASAAALSGLFAALNPGKRQEDNRLTALGAQALRRELRVLRERDIHHDSVVRARVREALEDLTIRFEAILGRPAEPTFWRRNNPDASRPMATTAEG